MSGYRIGVTVIKNFLAIKSAKLDFSQAGLTVIEGEVKNVPGCDSNGAGKSALIEAPVWAITGRTIREDCSGDAVIRHGSTGGCVVECLITGAKSVRIVRHRGHPTHANKVFLYVDGKDVTRGTSRQTDAAIEQEIGMDFQTMLNTVAFGARAEVKSFFFASDSARKAVLDKLLGLSVFSDALALTKARIREAHAELDPIMTKQMSIGFAIEEKRKAIQEVEGLPRVSTVELNDARLVVKTWTQRVAAAKDALAASKSELDEAQKAFQQVLREFDASTAAHNKAQLDAARLVSKKEEAARTKTSAIAKARTRIESLRSLKGTCPTCMQSVAADAVESVVRVLLAEIAELQAAAAKDYEEAKVTSKHAASVKPPERPADHDLRAHIIDHDLRRSDLSSAEASLEHAKEKAEAAAKAHAQTTERLGTMRTQLSDLQEALDANLDAQGELKERISRLVFWEQAFGNRGVKSFLIESEIPKINEVATRYARILLGEGTTVRLSATSKTKQDEEREEMSVDAVIPGRAQHYGGASKGQRHRLDLALILAFRAVVAARSACPFDQLFADELFDGVDETGIHCVIEILSEISKACPVVLVTHDSRLKSVGDRHYVVRHDGDSATLVK